MDETDETLETEEVDARLFRPEELCPPSDRYSAFWVGLPSWGTRRVVGECWRPGSKDEQFWRIPWGSALRQRGLIEA